MDHQHALLLSDLCHKYGQVQLALFRDFLAWNDIRKNWRRSSASTSPTAHGHAVHTTEIVAVHKTDTSDQTRATKHLQLNPHAFTVFYVRRTTQHQWRCDDVTFYCDNLGLCQHWIQTINDQLATQTNRPKSLLVYINPYGGKRDGKHIYDQKVAPLFCRACITTDVIVTERANHARDHLKTEANLDRYDGVVSVGGDGMFNEILHGLVARTQKEHGIDANRSDAHLAPCSLRIGIIPAGSTDCICFATVGTNDPVTSALHIIVVLIHPQFDHSFVEVHRVRKFRFQPRHDEPVSLEDLSGPQKQADQGPVCSRVTGCHYGNCGCSHWTCDGEILPHVAIQVSVQCQLIRVFARGIEEKNHHQSPLWLLEAAAHQSAG